MRTMWASTPKSRPALGPEELAGHDRGTPGAQARARRCGSRLQGADEFLKLAVARVEEERGRVVHQVVKAAEAGKGGVQRGLVAGEQRSWVPFASRALEVVPRGRRCGCACLSFELRPQGGRCLAYCARSQRSAYVTMWAGKIVFVEPAGEREDAAFGAAELLDLGDDDGAGVGGGLLLAVMIATSAEPSQADLGGGTLRTVASSLGERVERREELGEGDGGGFGAMDLGVSPSARRAAMQKAMAMR